MYLICRSIRPSSVVRTARILLISAVPLLAQGQSDAGIPVTDPLVLAKCGTCHAADERGNLQRISWARGAEPPIVATAGRDDGPVPDGAAPAGWSST